MLLISVEIIFFKSFHSQQLLRERQQMASRPFATVDVALEVGSEQTHIIRGPLEVRTMHTLTVA